MVTLLHGPDDLLRLEHLAAIRKGIGPAELADLSATWLDGRKASIAEIRHHCDALPFLTPRRLVVVEGLLAQLSKRARSSGRSRSDDGGISLAEEDQASLVAYLSQLPESTDLVLVETSLVERKHPVYKVMAELAREQRAQLVRCEAPPAKELPAWIARRARQKQAEIDPSAARELAVSIGRNLQLIDSELEKLITYRGGEGPVRTEDVRLLVPYAQEANIFEMVDAIGRQDSARAVGLLQELTRDGAAPLYVLAMIVRQFRLLVQVGELMAQGLDQRAISKAIGLHPYPTEKVMRQSRRWRPPELLAAYDRLLATDLAVKTGKMADDLALELLVVDLSQRQTTH